ncbi:HNH endonuclease signature motif containing protein [Sporosarcina sp. D27]|uniref:HNH endonuclease signature motif containing protein n=1 Tax=Sporosarcina sp. D27 TaxID=1382305 RepID=UPI0004703592
MKCICRVCGQEKSIDLFERDSRSKTGTTTRCKACKYVSNSKSAKAYARLRERQNKYPIPVETDRQEFDVIFEHMDDSCSYCGCEYTRTPTVDHIQALKNGGRHHISNLTLVCKSCNSAKCNKPLLVYYEQNFFNFPQNNLNSVVHYIAYFSGRTFDEVVEELEEQKRKYCEARGWDYYATDFIRRTAEAS